MKKINRSVFKFKPFSKKQRKLLNWWCPDSLVKDYDGIIADGAIRSGKTIVWCKDAKGKWTCIREYYYSGRDEKNQKTDSGFADDLAKWLGGIKPEKVVVYPAAASFIAELKKRGYQVKKANNDVLDGIRYVASLLTLDKIAICRCCENTIKEFALYIWDAKAADRGEDKPVKQSDHCMDALRYMCYTIIRKPVGMSILR